jgi:hypothetical protein
MFGTRREMSIWTSWPLIRESFCGFETVIELIPRAVNQGHCHPEIRK